MQHSGNLKNAFSSAPVVVPGEGIALTFYEKELNTGKYGLYWKKKILLQQYEMLEFFDEAKEEHEPYMVRCQV